MKNKFIKISVCFLALTYLAGCESKLDEFQSYSQVTLDNFYQTPQDFEQAKNALYSAFRVGGYYNGSGAARDYAIVPDVMSDNLIFNTEGRQSGRATAEFTFTANDTPSSIYNAAYFMISRANSILDRIDVLTDGDFKNDIQAQALAMRGIAHFDVVRSYSKIPTQSADANASIGVPYVETYDPLQTPPRLATVAETYDKIIADLELASTLINTTTTDPTFLSLRAVKGILSRVYLFKGDYTLAAQRAQECIDAGATLVSRNNFPLLWLDATNDDVLFKIAITQQDANQIGSGYNQLLTGSIFSEYLCDFGLYQLYQNNDVRKNAYIQTSETNGITYNHIIKYFQDAAGQRFVDGKYLRTSEVYLNMAEAKFRLGDQFGAAQALNQIRSRRYSGFTPGNESGENLINAILLERRLELAFESDRFYTLKRLGLPLQRSGFGHQFDGTGNIASPQSVPASDFRWNFPIDQVTLNLNPNIVQNAGYSN